MDAGRLTRFIILPSKMTNKNTGEKIFYLYSIFQWNFQFFFFISRSSRSIIRDFDKGNLTSLVGLQYGSTSTKYLYSLMTHWQ